MAQLQTIGSKHEGHVNSIVHVRSSVDQGVRDLQAGIKRCQAKAEQAEKSKVAAEERQKRAKGIFYGEPTQKTFFDFLGGSMDDENYLVNPNARKHLKAGLEAKALAAEKKESKG